MGRGKGSRGKGSRGKESSAEAEAAGLVASGLGSLQTVLRANGMVPPRTAYSGSRGDGGGGSSVRALTMMLGTTLRDEDHKRVLFVVTRPVLRDEVEVAVTLTALRTVAQLQRHTGCGGSGGSAGTFAIPEYSELQQQAFIPSPQSVSMTAAVTPRPPMYTPSSRIAPQSPPRSEAPSYTADYTQPTPAQPRMPPPGSSASMSKHTPARHAVRQLAVQSSVSMAVQSSVSTPRSVGRGGWR